METHIKKIEEGVIDLAVSLDQAELTGYIQGVERDMGADISVDGFRRGKVPPAVAKKHLNIEAVRQSALEIALSDSLARAIREHHFDVAASENLKVQENSATGLKYTVTLRVFPEVVIPELSTITATRKPIEVQDKEIQESIDVIRNMRARFSLKDGQAETGDRVEVDFEVKLGGALIEGGESKNHPLIIGGKNFMPGFEEQLTGMKVGDTKQFELTAPKDYYVQKIAGKKLNFSVTMKQIQTVELPKMDDEFAKGAGRFASLEELRENVAKGIRQEKEVKEKERIRLELLGKIAEVSGVKPPNFTVQEQLDAMVANFDRDLHAKGLELPLYLAQIGKSEEDLRKDWTKDAQRQAVLMLVLRAVAKSKGVQVDDQEIDTEVNATVQMLVSRGQANVQNLDLGAVRERIADRMFQEKTFEYLESNCKII